MRTSRTAGPPPTSWAGSPPNNGEMAARLGIMYVIYNRKIWASYSPGWRDYTGADPHTSHIHISLSWNGARAHTSFWTGRTWPLDYGSCQVFAGQPAVVAAKRARTVPCDPPAPTPHRHHLAACSGWAAPVPRWARPNGCSEYLDQHLRPGDPTAVLAYQARHELPRTGHVDDPTWASLSPASIKASKPAWTPAAGARWAQRRGYPEVRVTDAGRRSMPCSARCGCPAPAHQLLRAALPAPPCCAAKARLGLPQSTLVTEPSGATPSSYGPPCRIPPTPAISTHHRVR